MSARALFLTVALFLACRAACAGEIARSGPERVALLELYTSEGCSSCPSAEEWLTKLVGDKDLWKRFVPVAFHVDYWNKLGWEDAYSDAAYTARENAYAALWGSDEVHTPCFVLNGKEYKFWRGGNKFRESSGKPGELSLQQDGPGQYRIRFKPDGRAAQSYLAAASVLGFGLLTDVKYGENAGKILRHDFTALQTVAAPMTAGEDGWFEAALSFGEGSGKRAIAAWVSEGDSPAPVQAAGAELA